MKKKINTKAPSYAFGIDRMYDLGGTALYTAGSAMEASSDDSSNTSVGGSTLKGLGAGAAAGASIGSVIPGIGTAIGGVVGAVGGALSGLFSGRRKKKREQERQYQERALNVTEMGLNNAAQAEDRYWDENTLAYTYANGGRNLAYVDNNEVLRTIDGTIYNVPNTKPGTDNHLIDATNLDSVLSDNLKVPGTNRTFAQEGKRLSKLTKSSEFKDRYSENSDMLNKRNANKKYNDLLNLQEEVKTKKGIKPKSKVVPAYEGGLGSFVDSRKNAINAATYEAYGNFFDELGNAISSGLNSFGNALGYFPTRIFSPFINNKDINEAVNRARNISVSSNSSNSNNVNSSNSSGNKTSYYTPFRSQADSGLIMINPSIANMGMPFVYPAEESVDPIVAPYIGVEDFTPTIEPVAIPTAAKATISTTSAQPTVTTQRTTTDPLTAPKIPLLDVNRVAYPTSMGYTRPANRPEDYDRARAMNEPEPSNNLGSLVELAPTLYNFIQGARGPETEPLVYNPMQPTVMRTMARRRANIEPTLRANRRSRAIANYNASNTNTNTGMNMAMRTQLAADEYNANADAYARRDNVNNEYLAQYASTLNDLGNQWVQARNLYQDLNARNRAAARNYTGAAATQLSNWYQTEERMRNQAARDAQVLPFLADFLRGGFTNEQVENLINRTRQGA